MPSPATSTGSRQADPSSSSTAPSVKRQKTSKMYSSTNKRIDTSLYAQWKAVLSEENIRGLEVRKIGEGNYWIAIRSSQGTEKFQCRVPPSVLCVKRVNLAGSGDCFKGETLKGNRQLTLYVDARVIRESVAKTYNLRFDDTLPTDAEADIKFLVEQGTAFIQRYMEVKRHILGLMYDAKIMSVVHADQIEPEPILQRERYIVNGLATPKKRSDQDGGGWHYYDIANVPEWATQQIQARCRAWTGVYPRTPEIMGMEKKLTHTKGRDAGKLKTLLKEAKNLITVKAFADARTRAEADIVFCDERGYPHETADDQLGQCGLPKKGVIFQPLAVKEARTNKLVQCPWDGSVIENGALVSCLLTFKITQYPANNMAYLRDGFSELCVHWQTKLGQEMFLTDTYASRANAEESFADSVAVTTVMDGDIKLPSNPIPIKDADDEDDSDDSM